MSHRWMLFDFDGTITTRDTTRILLLELLRIRPWKIFCLAGFVGCRVLRMRPERMQATKNACIGCLIKGLGEGQLAPVVARYQDRAARLFRVALGARIREAVGGGARVLVVSASPDFAIRDIFRHDDIVCIGTRYRAVSGFYDGLIEGAPCYGVGKIAAIESALGPAFQMASIEEAWTDSASDLPMMQLARNRYWVCDEHAVDDIRRMDPGANIVLASSAG